MNQPRSVSYQWISRELAYECREDSTASVAEEASSKAIVPFKPVEEIPAVESSAQREGEVSTSVPPQSTPAPPQASSAQVVPPTPQTQGELSEEAKKQQALVEEAKEQERQKRLKEAAAGKKPAPDTPKAAPQAPKLLGSSMAADAALRQRQAAADDELLKRLAAENQGKSQEEIEAEIEQEKEKQAVLAMKKIKKSTTTKGQPAKQQSEDSSKLPRRTSTKQSAQREAPEPKVVEKVAISPKATKTYKRKASEPVEEAVEEPTLRKNPRRGATKEVSKPESSKAKKGSSKGKKEKAKKSLPRLKLQSQRRRKVKTPSPSYSEPSSSSEETESERDLSEEEFASQSEDDSSRFAEERMYAMKVRTHGERIKQKAAKPSKKDIVLVKKIPDLSKNYVPKDLKKKTSAELRALRYEHGNPFKLIRTASDDRFWTSFQQDYYQTVISTLGTIIAPMKWIEWVSIEDEPVLNGLEDKCKEAGVREIMALSCDWSEELVMQFYATFYFEGSMDANPKIHWMTDGQEYIITKKEFCDILGLPFEEAELGEETKLTKTDQIERTVPHMKDLLYFHNELPCTMWSTKNMKPVPYSLNNCLRVTLSPKIGDATFIRGHVKWLLTAILEGKKVDVARHMLMEMQEACCSSSKSLPYACYIHFLVEQVTKKTFFKEIAHNSYVPQTKPLEKLVKEVEKMRKEKEQQQGAPVQVQDQPQAPPAPEISSASVPSSSQVPAPAPATTLVSEVTPQATLNVVSNMALEVKNLKEDFEKSQKVQEQMVLALQGLATQVARLVDSSSSSSKPAEDPPAPPSSS